MERDCTTNVQAAKGGILSRLNELLRELRGREPALASDLEREVAALADRRVFGLNFERHVPEVVELPGRKVRKGDKVRILPPRGQMPKQSGERLWRVIGIDRSVGAARLEPLAAPVQHSAETGSEAGEDYRNTRTTALDDLVVVAEFRDPIYPGLISTGKVERGGDKPFHALINAENFHALETLLFTHRGRVDCIYIDPPYNTGAKDWKYNNHYVESDDLYRHSKWLAFIERRLVIAKELLNPADSVLIVTIDEKEYLRLGLLLEQTFPEAKIQMVSSVIKPGGTSRTKEFSRVEEYLYFAFIGTAELVRTNDNMLGVVAEEPRGISESDLWEGMVRRGIGVVRAQRPKQFYPIFVDAGAGRIVSAGNPLPLAADRNRVEPPEGLTAVWPIKDDGTEGFWQLSPPGLESARAQGTVRVGSFNERTGQWRIQYMKAKKAKAVADGLVATLGKDEHGVVILDLDNSSLATEATPRTVWNKSSHDASASGAGLLNKIIPGRRFPFPKSLYAVEDSLRFFVADKPHAVIIDFFAGSGTTAHAVMRLNKQDGGRRVSISVTNNEVSADEEAALRKKELRPGDAEWERWGISEYITKARLRAAITGKTPEGDPIRGDYKFTDVFPMENGFAENVEFFTLTYEAPLRVASNRAFTRIAPLLWLRAGSRGRRIEDISKGWDVSDSYGVLADLDHTEDFLKAIATNGDIATAFVVTDEERLFESVAQNLPDRVEPVRLFEAYLRNFEIESGRGLL